MRLFLDTEFNGFGGELISLALVADDGAELYIIRNLEEDVPYHPWVEANVLPRLAIDDYSGKALSDLAFAQEFSTFVYRYRGAEIIADWPADIEHFCNMLSWNGSQNGWRIPGSYTMRLFDRQSDYVSALPHNALSDARALRDYCRDWIF